MILPPGLRDKLDIGVLREMGIESFRGHKVMENSHAAKIGKIRENFFG